MLILKAEILAKRNIAHGFFGRQGGVSRGLYASLNCGPGSNDASDLVAENRRRAMAALCDTGPPSLVTCYQVHGARCVVVSEPWQISENPEADAMVTDRPGIALGILTADCAPILLADEASQIIGAAHAGWNGAISGIVGSVIAAMVSLGATPHRIHAAVGPCIGQGAYEVGPEFWARFQAAEPDNTRFFVRSTGSDTWRFDLQGYAADLLAQAGVQHIEALSACTYRDEDSFYSYRRATHQKEAVYGRQLSAILRMQ